MWSRQRSRCDRPVLFQPPSPHYCTSSSALVDSIQYIHAHDVSPILFIIVLEAGDRDEPVDLPHSQVQRELRWLFGAIATNTTTNTIISGSGSGSSGSSGGAVVAGFHAHGDGEAEEGSLAGQPAAAVVGDDVSLLRFE